MAGPVPPYPPVGPEAQPAYPAASDTGPYPGPYPAPSGYPEALPPPVPYPAQRPSQRRGARAAVWSLLGLSVVAALVIAAVAVGGNRAATGPAVFTESATKTAIQDYLNALATGDTETVARNTLCGMYDAIKERRSDLALARLASDAFRKQFARAEVVSVDKIVPSSSFQAQVLFTMRVAPAASARSARGDEQAIAQVLRQDNRLLVCSYLLRTAAQY